MFTISAMTRRREFSRNFPGKAADSTKTEKTCDEKGETSMEKSAQQWIEELGLAPIEEGGYCVRNYTAG